ncbi:AMP-binding protein [Actinomadura yumaensis]|uniref:AMP-binding protein n=1 Tax=Actinomadura yumaensis TaxID=111807 RepID=UPI00360A6088
MRLLISGGDRASPSAVARAARGLPGCRVVNGYGPTEATVYACCHVIANGADGADERPTPIGGPIPGVTARILGADGRPADQGERGSSASAARAWPAAT